MRTARAIFVFAFFLHLSLSAGASDRLGAGLSSLPPTAQSSISAALGRDIGDYRVQVQAAGLHAESSEHMLAADFTADGVEVRGGGAHWRMKLYGFGYGDAIKAIESVTPKADLNRVEYRHESLTEWYVNGPSGLEQGFTINDRPGSVEGQPLTVALDVPADSITTIDEDRAGLTLRGRSGKGSLRYRGLVACDANGRQLSSWMELRAGRLLLKVDDAGARYPVVVDPWLQLAELTASDGRSYDNLGYSIAVSGSTVVVGAPGASINGDRSQGAAYVFVEAADGWANMTQTAKLTASDGDGQDDFGISVGIDGNTVVVGAPYNNRLGAAYVFVEPSSGWENMTQTAKLTASDAAAFDYFGYAVAISGNTVVVGEPRANVIFGFQGAAYVFVKPGNGWVNKTQNAKLTASDGGIDDALGFSISISGNTVIAGAPGWPSGLSQGAAYLFVQPAKGWTNATQTSRLLASNGITGDEFGYSTSISGAVAAAGARFKRVSGNAAQGAAYVFQEPPNGWRPHEPQNGEITTSDGQAGDEFGYSVSVNGTGLFVGAAYAAVNGNVGQGAAYLYLQPKGYWKSTNAFAAKLSASDGTAGASFGASVANGNSTLIVGAATATIKGNAAQGEAYVFGP